VVLGHEAAGVVAAVGPGVTHLVEGDHVVCSPCAPCGLCPWCVRGEWSLCVTTDALVTAAHPDGGTACRGAGRRSTGVSPWPPSPRRWSLAPPAR
jgi:Zn-dependent alcohol dehydrogenase